MNLDKIQIKKIIGIIAFAIFLFYALNNFNTVLSVFLFIYKLIFPFILGGCIAFIINIPMNIFEKKLKRIKGGKIISLFLAYLTILAVIGLVICIVTPQIIETAQAMPATFQTAGKNLEEWVNGITWLSGDIISYVQDLEIDWMKILDNLKSMVFSGAGSMISSTIGVATSFATGAVNLLIGIVFSIYVLLQKEKLGKQCRKLLYAYINKKKSDSIIEIASLSSETFSNFFTGQCLEAVILGLLFFITMTIFRFPYTMVISVLIGCLSLIPICGAFIGCAIGIFLIVMVNPIQSLIFLVVFLVLQQIEGNLIYPRVVGNSVGLPSIWVLVAVTVGAGAMGVIGMIIFIPICSVVYTLLRKNVYKRLHEKGINFEEDINESGQDKNE